MPRNNPTNMQYLIQSVKAVMHETGDWKDYPCLLWDRGLVYGYGQVSLGHSNHRVHRVAWETANGKIPEGVLICHHCDVHNCFRPIHLFAGSQQDNIQDCMNKGRYISNLPELPFRGESHARSKLTNESVLEIRRMAAAGMGQTEIGLCFGLRQSYIYKIVHREIWKHV